MQSTFLWEAPPARASASPGSEPGWLTPGETSCSPILPLLQNIGPAGWSGRMSPASCRRGRDGTLVPSSLGWQNSGMGSPTEFLTLSTSEWAASAEQSLNDAVVCSLSDILETGDQLLAYCLSPKACRGILRRAAKRGKALPGTLQAALTAVAATGTTPTLPRT